MPNNRNGSPGPARTLADLTPDELALLNYLSGQAQSIAQAMRSAAPAEVEQQLAVAVEAVASRVDDVPHMADAVACVLLEHVRRLMTH